MDTIFEAHISQNYRSSRHLSSSWHKKSANYERTSDIKMSDREAICLHFLKYFTQSQQIRLLSMPGQHWYFEHLLSNKHPDLYVIAIEKSREIMERNKSAILGANRGCHYRNANFGDAKLEFLKTPNSAWIHANLSTFTTMMLDGYGASMKQRQGWNDQFCINNAAWLDFTSPICEEVTESLESLHMVMNPSFGPKPVAITMMYGRDTDPSVRGGIGPRKAYMERHIKGFRAISHNQYLGLNGCPMLTIMGVME